SCRNYITPANIRLAKCRLNYRPMSKDVPGLENGRHSADLEWIAHLRADNGVWIFVTGDGRVLKNKAERQALRGAGLHGFLLPPAYQKTPLHQVAAQLVLNWPDIEAVTAHIAAPSMHEIPIGKRGKLKSLQW
ncbi:hypothetical protein, partial [Acidiphilium sp.]